MKGYRTHLRNLKEETYILSYDLFAFLQMLDEQWMDKISGEISFALRMEKEGNKGYKISHQVKLNASGYSNTYDLCVQKRETFLCSLNSIIKDLDKCSF